jgi:hypothetical protein
LVRNP